MNAALKELGASAHHAANDMRRKHQPSDASASAADHWQAALHEAGAKSDAEDRSHDVTKTEHARGTSGDMRSPGDSRSDDRADAGSHHSGQKHAATSVRLPASVERPDKAASARSSNAHDTGRATHERVTTSVSLKSHDARAARSSERHTEPALRSHAEHGRQRNEGHKIADSHASSPASNKRDSNDVERGVVDTPRGRGRTADRHTLDAPRHQARASQQSPGGADHGQSANRSFGSNLSATSQAAEGRQATRVQAAKPSHASGSEHESRRVDAVAPPRRSVIDVNARDEGLSGHLKAKVDDASSNLSVHGWTTAGGASNTLHSGTNATGVVASTHAGGEATGANTGMNQSALAKLNASIQMLHAAGGGNTRIRMDPPSLGEIEIRLQMKGGQKAQVSFHASQSSTAHALHAGMPELTAAMQQHGIQLTHTNTTTPGNGGDAQSSLMQGRQDSSGRETPGEEAAAGEHSPQGDTRDAGQPGVVRADDNGVRAYA